MCILIYSGETVTENSVNSNVKSDDGLSSSIYKIYKNIQQTFVLFLLDIFEMNRDELIITQPTASSQQLIQRNTAQQYFSLRIIITQL